jgi:hypothetical protein
VGTGKLGAHRASTVGFTQFETVYVTHIGLSTDGPLKSLRKCNGTLSIVSASTNGHFGDPDFSLPHTSVVTWASFTADQFAHSTVHSTRHGHTHFHPRQYLYEGLITIGLNNTLTGCPPSKRSGDLFGVIRNINIVMEGYHVQSRCVRSTGAPTTAAPTPSPTTT